MTEKHNVGFLTFKDKRFTLNQSLNVINSVLMFDTSVLISASENKRLVSSAYKMKLQNLLQLVISLIYNMSNKGPRIETCGTPQETN